MHPAFFKICIIFMVAFRIRYLENTISRWYSLLCSNNSFCLVEMRNEKYTMYSYKMKYLCQFKNVLS